MSNKKAYISTITASFLIQVAGIVSGILSARLLGPENKGLQVVIFLVPTLLVSFFNLSIPFSTAFLISKNKYKLDEVVSSTFWLSVTMSAGLIILACIFYRKFIPEDKIEAIPILRWYIALIPLSLISMSLLGIDHGRQAFVRYNILRILPPILYALGMCVLWFMNRVSLKGFVACNLIGIFIVTLIRVWVAGKNISPKYLNVKLIRELLVRGLMLHLPTLATILFLNVDRLLLTRFVDSTSLGIYSVALAVAMGQFGLASAFVQVTFVKLASKTDISKAKKEMALHIRYAHFMISIMTTMVLIACPYLIRFAFGSEYIDSIKISYPLIIAISLFGLASVFDNSLRGLGYSISSSIGNILGTAIAVGFGILLVPKYKGLGMALAMLIATSSMLAYFICYSRYVLQIPLKELWGFRIDVVRQISKTLSDIFSRVILSRSVPIGK